MALQVLMDLMVEMLDLSLFLPLQSIRARVARCNYLPIADKVAVRKQVDEEARGTKGVEQTVSPRVAMIKDSNATKAIKASKALGEETVASLGREGMEEISRTIGRWTQLTQLEFSLALVLA
jgi:hypothetical protein